MKFSKVSSGDLAPRRAASPRVWALVLALASLGSGSVLGAGSAQAAPAARGSCFDTCAARRPSAADQKTYATCMSAPLLALKPQAQSVRRQPAASKAAAWSALHATHAQHATRCAPASMKAWNTCMSQCPRPGAGR